MFGQHSLLIRTTKIIYNMGWERNLRIKDERIPMNIAFFLIPKQEVVTLHEDATMRQALEKMEFHQYTAVPIIDKKGKYVGTVTEGDFLWTLKNTPGLSFDNMHKVPLSAVKKRMKNDPVSINARMEDLLSLAAVQNFVPVIDDQGVFVGIIRRREIIEYCTQLIDKTKTKTDSTKSDNPS